uniref:Uncharacterized protein n=1 Tax=Romanomermis culicivorax TaxID=13658 RepID=A0A915J945_ROMCU
MSQAAVDYCKAVWPYCTARAPFVPAIQEKSNRNNAVAVKHSFHDGGTDRVSCCCQKGKSPRMSRYMKDESNI